MIKKLLLLSYLVIIETNDIYARNNTDTSIDMKKAKWMIFVYFGEKTSKRHVDSAIQRQARDFSPY